MLQKRIRGRAKRALGLSLCALLVALICALFTPLTALACGGLFSADSYTEQSAEHLLYALDPGRVTLYEQIQYTGAPKNFAWILPVPSVPTVGTAPLSLFSNLDQMTAPRFTLSSGDTCGSFTGAAAAPPSSASPVNVYSSGTVGPYSYDVISSKDPHALTTWLSGHSYKIPAESQAEMKPYIAAHMLFLAMRLKGNTGTQNMQPVKVSYASTQAQVTIPLRMATPMSKNRLGVVVWILANSRYVPQNYQALQVVDSQLRSSENGTLNYSTLVDQAVDKAQGHGFVTEFAQPTSGFSTNDPTLSTLLVDYGYLTRLYTQIAPNQITLDPAFVSQTGLPNVSQFHAVPNTNADLTNCGPSTFQIASDLLAGALVITVGMVLLAIFRRKKLSRH